MARGLGKGAYKPFTPILDAAGVPLAHHPDELARFLKLGKSDQDGEDAIQLRVASFGSWPAPVDWDDDGDFDLLIGAFNGSLFLRTNVGSRTAPSFSPTSLRIEADGKPVKTAGHACPVVADWDADGRFDLVLGSADGSVVWHRNEGAAKAPKFGPARPLVSAKAKHKFLTQYLSPGEEPAPGVRAQIAVEDYDGDGKLDLLLGDYSDIVELKALSADERKAFDQLLAERERLGSAAAAAKDDSPDQQKAYADMEKIEARQKEFHRNPKAKERRASFVWLYRRVATE